VGAWLTQATKFTTLADYLLATYTGEDGETYETSPERMKRLFGKATKEPLRMAFFLKQDELSQVCLNAINVRWRLGAPLFNDPYIECRCAN
jgi:hypothetical protein